MIPIHDENPTRRFPWLTVTLISVNIAVFAYELTRTPAQLTELIGAWAFVPAGLASLGTAGHAFVTVFASAFLHGGVLHIAGNMLYLWVFGNNIEDRLGPLAFGGFYAACALGAAAAQTMATPASLVPMVGASGAIAGVLGAYLILYPRARVVTVVPVFLYLELAALPAGFVIGFWFLLQIAQGVTSLGGTMQGGVAWWAHIGGFATGVVLAAPIAMRDTLARRRRRTASRRAR